MQAKTTLGLLLAGLLLAACSQQMGRQTTAQQVGSLGAAQVIPMGAAAAPNGMVLHPGFHVQGLDGMKSSTRKAIDKDFEQDIKNYRARGKDHGDDAGRTQITTIGALKAKGMFTADPYVDGTQVVLKTAHGAFKDVYDGNRSGHQTSKKLVAIYDPQTGFPLGIGLPSGR